MHTALKLIQQLLQQPERDTETDRDRKRERDRQSKKKMFLMHELLLSK